MTKNNLRQIILDFPKQLATSLNFNYSTNLPKADKFIVCGMGGSALAAGLLKVYKPELDLLIHRDYGLPRVPKYFLDGSLLILSSYSGNTEEVLDTLQLALERTLKVAIMAAGGELLAVAEQLKLPHLVLPAGLPPRQAIGYFFVGLCRLMGAEADLVALRELAKVLQPAEAEAEGRRLAGLIGARRPVIYASTVNWYLAYNWKIRFNEDSKIAAFANVLPEMNHNELAAPDDHFIYFLLRDPADDPRIKNRFAHLVTLFKKQNLAVEEIILTGDSTLEKIFNSVILADWTAYHLALAIGQNPAATPLIEEFKKQIKLNLN
ncbi:MAG: SIS domain-containing protein [Patescibacteria group bacterium]